MGDNRDETMEPESQKEGYSRRDIAKLLTAGFGVALAGCAASNETASADSIGSRSEALNGNDIRWVDTVLGVAAGVTPRTGDLATNTNVTLSATVVIAKGCVTAGDGGGGLFYWSASGTDDGGTVIVPNGSTSGCWKRVLPEQSVYNVYWFGVAGDLGVATMAADAALGSQNGTILIPSGGGNFSTGVTLRPNRVVKIGAGTFTNSVNGQLFQVSDNTVIQGTGRDTTLMESSLASPSNLNAYIVLAGSPNTTRTNLTFRDLVILGNPAVTAMTAVVATVNTYNCQVGLIENVCLNGTHGIGIQISGINQGGSNAYSESVVVRNCFLVGVGGGGGVNIALTNNQNCAVEDCIVLNPLGAAVIDLEPNVTADRLINNKIMRNRITGANTGGIFVYLIMCTNSAIASVYGNAIMDNVLDEGDVGVHCFLSDSLVARNTIINCSNPIVVTSFNPVGNPTQRVTVQNNKIYQNRYFWYTAIRVDGSYHCKIVGNEVAGLGANAGVVGESGSAVDYNLFFNNMTPFAVSQAGANTMLVGNIIPP